MKYNVHKLFLAGIILKAVDGILELIGGFFLLITNSNTLYSIVNSIFRGELIEDPADFIANYFLHFFQNLPKSAIIFAAIYLLAHGLIKLGIVTGLLSKKLWAHTTAGIILLLIVIYQIFRLTPHFSILLLFLTIIDIIIIVLVVLENRRIKKSIA